MAGSQYKTSGSAVYAGLTDLPSGLAGDHDYEDLVVRVSVPEASNLLLLSAGLLGLGLARRRRSASTTENLSV